jgi:hypothetical protein
LDESQSIGKSGEEMEKKLEKLFDLILMISWESEDAIKECNGKRKRIRRSFFIFQSQVKKNAEEDEPFKRMKGFLKEKIHLAFAF